MTKFDKQLASLSNDKLIRLVFSLPATTTILEKELAHRLDIFENERKIIKRHNKIIKSPY